MTAFSPAVALCAGPGEGSSTLLPDLNEVPTTVSAAEIAQFERETEENAAECERFINEICRQAEDVARKAGSEARILYGIEGKQLKTYFPS